MSSADDVKMSEKPVPETLESIAARIEALNQRFDAVDQRFDGVDQRFAGIDQRFTTVDQQMAEMKAHLGIKIEAVDAKVATVYDAVIAMREEAKRNATEHRTFTKRLDDHDVRILALEKPAPPKP
jgi:hypothetical protein